MKISPTSFESQSGKAVKEINSEAKSGNGNGDMEFLAKSKSLVNLSNNIRVTRPDFLIFDTKKAFYHLSQMFIEAPILQYFDLEYYIQIKTNVLDYIIGDVLSQLTSNNLVWWYLVAYFFRKMIIVETRYKTYNDKLLAIVEVFKT